MSGGVREHLERFKRMDAETQQHARTRYVIKLNVAVRNGQTATVYASPRWQWTQHEERAQRFGSITAANGYAVNVLDLPLDSFTVEPVA